MAILVKIAQWDDSLLGVLEPIRHSDAWRKWFLGISSTGNGSLYVAVSALVCALDPPMAGAYMTVAVTAFLFGLPAHIFLKKGIKRRRPCECDPQVTTHGFKPAERFSFPSGHTTHAFLMHSSQFR